MYYRCELLVNGQRYRVTDNLVNWDEVKASFKRGDYDGVVRTFSNKFSFALDARSLLLKQYEDNYLDASASVIISTRNNSWLYNERFSCALNFSTLQDDGSVLQINAIDDSVASLIKAKKGAQYEYSVNEVKDSIPLVYDGIELSESSKWIPTGDTVEEDESLMAVRFSGEYSPMPLYISASDTLIKGAFELSDQTVGDGSAYSVKALKSINANIDLHIDISIYYEEEKFEAAHTTVITKGVLIRVVKREYQVDNEGNTNIVETAIDNLDFTTTSTTHVNKIYTKRYSINMSKNDEIIIMSKVEWNADSPFDFKLRYKDYNVSSSSYFSISWKNRINAVEMDVVKPITLLNRLLKSMNGGKDGLTGVIESNGDKRLDVCMLLAAESARKIPNAKMHTSFTKFTNWMSSVFGYAYDISGNTVTFRHRSKYFSDNVVKKISNISDYEMKVNSSLVYSRIRIGYDKQDYDTANGKDEFRFTNEYTTGVTMTDNSLELISPYRADAYGIEFLADKIGEDTTDNESDTDLFMVGVKSNSSNTKYILNRDYMINSVLSPETMFNSMYAPSSMVLANELYIGVSAKLLTFASSDGNSDVSVDGMGENRDIDLAKKMFTVAEVEFETSDIELPEDLTGIVEFDYQGSTIQGYYQRADYSFNRSQSSKVTLIIKK